MDRELIFVKMGWSLIVVLEELIYRTSNYRECSAKRLTERVNKMIVYGEVHQEKVEDVLRMLESSGKINKIITESDECFEIPINRSRITAA